MTDDRPTKEDRNELLDTIESLDAAWCVDDWNYQSGMYDVPTITVQIEWSPPEPASLDVSEITELKTLIAKIESEHEGGAPLTSILRAAEDELGWKVDRASKEIDELRTKGEVYEPKPDHLRTT